MEHGIDCGTWGMSLSVQPMNLANSSLLHIVYTYSQSQSFSFKTHTYQSWLPRKRPRCKPCHPNCCYNSYLFLQLPVKPAVLDCLGEVMGLDVRFACHVGDGSGYAEDLVVGAGAQA